jgi:hypothetical protein
VHAYFNIDDPHTGTQWIQGGNGNLVTWTKGLLDDINTFDVELARMSKDGLILAARNVPTQPPRVNILLQDVPPGDDYFLIFINSTHGVMYATSSRFTILAPNTQPNATQPNTDGSVATITVNGGPDPTKIFGTTFAAVNGAVGSLFGAQGGVGVWMGVGVGLVGVGMGVGAGLVW